MLARLEREGTRVVAGRAAAAPPRPEISGARLTSSEYLVWLDADDMLEPGYFEAAAARLDADAELDLRLVRDARVRRRQLRLDAVAADVRRRGRHRRRAARLDDDAARGCGKRSAASTKVCRRSNCSTSGPRRSSGAFAGVILDEPLLNYRVRPDPATGVRFSRDVYRARLRHFYAKHRAAVERHGSELIERKEAFLVSQREYRRDARSAGGVALEAELADLGREIAETVRQLESRGVRASNVERRSPADRAAQPELGPRSRDAGRSALHRALSRRSPKRHSRPGARSARSGVHAAFRRRRGDRSRT